MSPLNSRVWRRYGQLRIYVSADNGPVGWFDPRTGRFQLSQPGLRDEFWAEVRAECQRQSADGHIKEPAFPPEASPAAPQQPSPVRPVSQPRAGPPDLGERWSGQHWLGQHRVGRDPDPDDLARNQPGASASARARELRREHPLLTSAAAVLGIRTSAQSFAAGARGERTVGRQLSTWAARYGWYVLHAVPVGRRGADIDHVVIGPFGVITVNTKTTVTAVWVGEYGLTVGGKSVDYLRKSRSEASRAGRLLDRATGFSVPVQPAIVFVGARRVAIRRGGPPDVAVLPSPRALRQWLRKQAPVLEPGQVDAIYAAARRPASWQSG
jgi:Nuclease-related domain